MRITYDELVQCGVDEERCEAFARRWPDGMEVTEETVREAVGMRVSLEWLARDLMRPVALSAYDEAIVPASRAYREATDRSRRAYREAIVPARSACREATDQARRAYYEEIAPVLRAYEETTDQALCAYEETTAPAERAYYEAVEQADREYDEARIRAVVEAAQIHDQEVE